MEHQKLYSLRHWAGWQDFETLQRKMNNKKICHLCLQWVMHPMWEVKCEREGIYTDAHWFGVRGGRLPFRMSSAWVPRLTPGSVVHKDSVTWVEIRGASSPSSCTVWERQTRAALVPSWCPIKHHLSFSGFRGCLQHYCPQTQAFPYELKPGHKKSTTK